MKRDRPHELISADAYLRMTPRQRIQVVADHYRIDRELNLFWPCDCHCCTRGARLGPSRWERFKTAWRSTEPYTGTGLGSVPR